MAEFGDRSWLEFTQLKRRKSCSQFPSLYLIGLKRLFLTSASQMEVGSSPHIDDQDRVR